MENLESFKLTVPNNLEYFDLAQFFVRDVAKKIGFKGNALNQIDIAVEESVTNVMKHAYDKEESKTIDIICQKIPDGIKIVVKDMGIPFDPNRIARFNITKNIEDLSTEGLGIFMLQKVVDDLSFQNLGHLGKEVHMVKYLHGSVQKTENNDPDQIAEDPKVITGKIDFNVRAMEPEEAIEVSRCAYKSHGYSFFDDHIYYPERLVEMNDTGEMISAVAVTKNNEFMGHAAILFQHPDENIAELTFAFVNIEYRGQGALNHLVDFLFTTPKKRELTGVYAYAVTNHIFTQKSLVKFGIKDTGILLATSPSSWKFKGISDDTSQRISVVLGFKYLKDPPQLTLYPPVHHKNIIEKLYKNLGVDHHFREPADSNLHFDSKDSDIKTGFNELEGCSELYIDHYGENILKEVRKILRGYCVQNFSSINMFLRLEDPLTYHLTPEFEKMGFFFAGILPDTRIGDTLLLQYQNNVEFDYSKVVLYLDFTKELLEYIRSNDPNEGI
jgi:serine/threonine-protein kinase RsbW